MQWKHEIYVVTFLINFIHFEKKMLFLKEYKTLKRKKNDVIKII